MEIRSILNDILEDIKGKDNEEEIKSIAINRIISSRIKDKDKVNMIGIIRNKKGVTSVLKAIYDLILKYEGFGVINKSLSGGKIRLGKEVKGNVE